MTIVSRITDHRRSGLPACQFGQQRQMSLALDVVADQLVGAVQLLYRILDLVRPVTFVRSCRDVDVSRAVNLGGVTDETVTLGVEQ